MNPDESQVAHLPCEAKSLWSRFEGEHVLLLQGPMGPFFRWVAEKLRAHGANVSKVSLNFADVVYYLPLSPQYLYRGTLANWTTYLADFIAKHRVTKVVLFGDCRPYHRAAVQCVQQLGIQVYVFEEGYLRPNYVTF